MFKRSLNLILIVTFIASSLMPIPKAHANELGLPIPGAMVNLSPAYEPTLIKGLTIHKDNPFLFDFIVDTGHSKMEGDALKAESDRLIKYFFACLTIPEKDLWVNLSPYEKDRMIPQPLGETALGRDLLSQDYILKQLTASLIYPEKDLGKEFWDRVYAKAQQMYGTTNIPVNTFNKVWIMADKATVYEHNQTAFVVNGHLKVMLEEDYLALTKNAEAAGPAAAAPRPSSLTLRSDKGSTSASPAVASQIIREIILPEIEKEVNTGKNFAQLRQIFNSLILATWYKKNLKEALLTQVYADKSTVNGVNLSDSSDKNKIYQQYLQAYKKGVFNYIKDPDPTDVGSGAAPAGPRKYFSGGFVVDGAMLTTVQTLNADMAQTTGRPTGNMMDVTAAVQTGGKAKGEMTDADHIAKFDQGEAAGQAAEERVASLDAAAESARQNDGAMTAEDKIMESRTLEAIGRGVAKGLFGNKPLMSRHINEMNLGVVGEDVLYEFIPSSLDKTHVMRNNMNNAYRIIAAFNAGAGIEPGVALNRLTNHPSVLHVLTVNNKKFVIMADAAMAAQPHSTMSSLYMRDRFASLSEVEKRREVLQGMKGILIAAGLYEKANGGSYGQNWSLRPFVSLLSVDGDLQTVENQAKLAILEEVLSNIKVDGWEAERAEYVYDRGYRRTVGVRYKFLDLRHWNRGDDRKKLIAEASAVVDQMLGMIPSSMAADTAMLTGNEQSLVSRAIRSLDLSKLLMPEEAGKFQLEDKTAWKEVLVSKNADPDVPTIVTHMNNASLRKGAYLAVFNGRSVLCINAIDTTVSQTEAEQFLASTSFQRPDRSKHITLEQARIILSDLPADRTARFDLLVSKEADPLAPTIVADMQGNVIPSKDVELKEGATFYLAVFTRDGSSILYIDAAMTAAEAGAVLSIFLGDTKPKENVKEMARTKLIANGNQGTVLNVLEVEMDAINQAVSTHMGLSSIGQVNGSRVESSFLAKQAADYEACKNLAKEILAQNKELGPLAIRYTQLSQRILPLSNVADGDRAMTVSADGKSVKFGAVERPLNTVLIVLDDMIKNLKKSQELSSGQTRLFSWAGIEPGRFRDDVVGVALGLHQGWPEDVLFTGGGSDLYISSEYKQKVLGHLTRQRDLVSSLGKIVEGINAQDPIIALDASSGNLKWVYKFEDSLVEDAVKSMLGGKLRKEEGQLVINYYPPDQGKMIITGPRELGEFGFQKAIQSFFTGIDVLTLNSSDAAMAAETPKRGGIDLNSTNMGMTVSKDANGGVKVTFDPAMIERIHREGVQSVVPVIINITPIMDIRPLLGLGPTKEEEEKLAAV